EPAVLQLDRLPVQLAALVLALQLEVALRRAVALRKHEQALVVGPEQLGAVNRERAWKAPSRERGQLVGAGRLARLGREWPFLAHHTCDPGGRGDENRLLLARQWHGLLLRAERERSRQRRSEREAPRAAGEDRVERGEGEGCLERAGEDCGARDFR